jgi:hypothetical protein
MELNERMRREDLCDLPRSPPTGCRQHRFPSVAELGSFAEGRCWDGAADVISLADHCLRDCPRRVHEPDVTECLRKVAE